MVNKKWKRRNNLKLLKDVAILLRQHRIQAKERRFKIKAVPIPLLNPPFPPLFPLLGKKYTIFITRTFAA